MNPGTILIVYWVLAGPFLIGCRWWTWRRESGILMAPLLREESR